MSKVIPFRNNPLIVVNWFNKQTAESLPDEGKKAYYDISVESGVLRIQFREEKQKTEEGSVESPWFSWLEFPLDSQFAKDLLVFLADYVPTEEEGAVEAGEENEAK
jgi:hypothetical protein